MNYLKNWILSGLVVVVGQLTLLAQISVQSESYSSSNGVQLETCADDGGGLNVGYIDTNDWMEYDLDIPMDGEYQISLRAASQSGGGSISITEEGSELGNLSIPSTGGWQIWSTVNGPNISLTSGSMKIRMTATRSGFNLNWFELKLVNPSDNDSPTVPVLESSSSDVHTIYLDWTESTDPTSAIANYKLFDGYRLLASTSESSVSLSKLSPNKEFNIKIRAYDLAGNFSESAITNISTTAIEWPLTWSDEFDGSSVNTDSWNYQVGGGGWGNNEVQYYTEGENSSVSDGLLTIEVKQETRGSNDYTSSRMNTSEKFDFKYGRIEIRATLPKTGGTWPAIWTLPTNWIYGGWPDSGEIDIMEHSATYGYGEVFGTIHTEAYNHTLGTQRGGGVTYEDVTNTFHTYTLEWYPDHLDWYFDDVLVFTFENEYKTSAEWPFDDEHHLLLNVAVGGSLGGDINHNGEWPQRMQVDYVRYYEIDFGKENDTEAPTAPSNLKADISGINIDLTWDRSVDNYYVEYYNVYLDDKLVESPSSPSLIIRSLKALTEYDISIESVDFAGNKSEKTALTITTEDIESVTIPGQFEAEDYLNMFGMEEEECTDTGGGVNMAFIDSGDWLEYSIDVPQSGSYALTVRTAANSLTGSLELSDDDGNILTTVQTPRTGGWQNWETVVSESFELSAGIQRITIHSLAKEFNLNWFELKERVALRTTVNKISSFEIFPNPITDGILTVRPALKGLSYHTQIFSLNGKMLHSEKFSGDSSDGVINTSSLKSGLYILRIEQGGNYSQLKFKVE